ncbi:unnamed protein product [Vitrella brassicaformis CCMP3155]|uniref:Uncharacterized protein n=1 Tax=Vitrella brassicaformis (strain CCMP3155) TaxID=1169540 RepID=A0A0G4ELV2_VITBC|nr:unnamed protein product [Vitrella brassicaformis CCMP3155]|eukprot:CEL97813.1 unnamed protein product [Vitrella brassicaformis CCMP3155]
MAVGESRPAAGGSSQPGYDDSDPFLVSPIEGIEAGGGGSEDGSAAKSVGEQVKEAYMKAVRDNEPTTNLTFSSLDEFREFYSNLSVTLKDEFTLRDELAPDSPINTAYIVFLALLALPSLFFLCILPSLGPPLPR